MYPKMQRFSPEIPWVWVQRRQGYDVRCEVCGATAFDLGTEDVAAFAQGHRVHQAPQGSMRLGDAVAAVAKPVARAFGMDPNCTPCEARRRAMNSVRRFW